MTEILEETILKERILRMQRERQKLEESMWILFPRVLLVMTT